MKYGDTLHQWSIPEWQHHNLDFNDIKHLIKARTTKREGQPQPIPGSNNENRALQDFEDELYAALQEQHERVDLFVRSKSGEIARRLAHLDTQIAKLEQQIPNGSPQPMSVRRLEKFGNLEDVTLKTGQEVHSLSRFVVAQRRGFTKLLKKYQRWTGSVRLGERFRHDVLDRPSSFSKQDFEYLLLQYTDILEAVRAPVLNPGASTPTEEHKDQAKPKDSARKLHAASKGVALLDLDTALAIVPFGKGAVKASYWVHADNIMQIQILLLNNARLRTISDAGSAPASPTSSKSSPKGSIHDRNALGPLSSTARPEDRLGVIICDDLQRFAERRSGETIGDSENLPGTASQKAAASIRYSSAGRAVVAVNTGGRSTGEGRGGSEKPKFRLASIRPKTVRQLFDPSSPVQNDKEGDYDSTEQVRQWLSGHPEVKPLVQLQSKRTRFIGLENTERQGIWATIDRDVSMRACTSETVATGGLFTLREPGDADSDKFPHAILEVRIEGRDSTNLVKMLDNTHLAERIRGFSLETHAVATVCKPQGMPRPFWFPLLSRNILKVPPPVNTGRVPKKISSPDQTSTRRTSLSISTSNEPAGSGFSILKGESSATSAQEIFAPPSPNDFKPKRKLSKRQKVRQRPYLAQSRPERYWNEFDNGSEGSQDEPYTIFVDPNASSTFPGVTAISSLVASVKAKATKSAGKAKLWVRKPVSSPRNSEREPLINKASPRPRTDDSENSDDDTISAPNTPIQRRYSSFPDPFPDENHHVDPQPVVHHGRETFLFRSCLASFAASIILLIIAALLLHTGRRKAATTVDIGVVIGVAASLVFAVIGVGSMAARQVDVGWVHRTIIVLFFVGIVAGNVGLVLAMAR